MRLVIASLLVAAAPAWAQAPSPNPQSSVLKKPAAAPKDMKVNCADCGEIRSVRKVTKEVKAEEIAPQQQPGGLVASIPLGGTGKAQVGSSTRVGDEAVRTTTRYEVTLRYDDGRYRLFMFDKQPDFAEGDRVRVDSRGQLLPP
jgi:outer membrane lipoprotein SlyB